MKINAGLSLEGCSRPTLEYPESSWQRITMAASGGLSLTQVPLYHLRNSLVAGIYVLIVKDAGENEYLTPLSFLIAAVIVGTTAFLFCEVSSY
jgi:hypothetical protein